LREEITMSFNKIMIVGNLGKDPELRHAPQGKAVCDFTIATNEKRKDKSGQQQDITTWFRITLWESQAEIAAKYLKKGRPVYIEGQLRVDEWTDRENVVHHRLEVRGTDVRFIDGGSRDAVQSSVGNVDTNEATE
jgi:single-strand DNA-binding protein